MAAAQRVLIVSEHPYPDHATLRRNAGQLVEAGLEVDIVCLAPANAGTGAGGHPSVHLHTLRMDHRRTGALRYVQEYVGFFAWAFAVSTCLSLVHRYTAVLADNPPDFLVFASLVARIRGARVVLEMFELTPELTAARMRMSPRHPMVRVTRAIERLAIWWADQVIVVSEQCRDMLASRGVDAGKMTVVPNTIPAPPEFGPPSHQPPPFVVTHCSLIERYGVQVAIQAFAQLCPRWPDLTFRVLGEGDYKPQLVQMVNDLGLTDRIVFRGFRPWIKAIEEIRQAEVGIVAIVADGYGELLLPTKLLEYADNEVPVACANLPTIRKHFPADAIGYFEPGDAAGLAAQLDRMLRDRNAARAQAVRAKAAMRALSWEILAPRYMAALGLNGAHPMAGAAA